MQTSEPLAFQRHARQNRLVVGPFGKAHLAQRAICIANLARGHEEVFHGFSVQPPELDQAWVWVWERLTLRDGYRREVLSPGDGERLVLENLDPEIILSLAC